MDPGIPLHIRKRHNQERQEHHRILQEKRFSTISLGKMVLGRLQDRLWRDRMMGLRICPLAAMYQARKTQAPPVLWQGSGRSMEITRRLI
jgi:hypothetical protein